MTNARTTRSTRVACVAARLLVIGLLLASATPALAQLTGGLEGDFIHHSFESTPVDAPPRVVVEAWADRKTGLLWVRGAVAPEVLATNLTLRSQVSRVGPPRDARPLAPQKAAIDAPIWLKQAHIWARPQDGVADTGLRLVLEPLCLRRCAVVAVEHYRLPGAGGIAGGPVKLAAVDCYPLEPGDGVTVYAPR